MVGNIDSNELLLRDRVRLIALAGVILLTQDFIYSGFMQTPSFIPQIPKLGGSIAVAFVG